MSQIEDYTSVGRVKSELKKYILDPLLGPVMTGVRGRSLESKVSSKGGFWSPFWGQISMVFGSKLSSKSRFWSPFWGQISIVFGLQIELKKEILEPPLGPDFNGVWVQSELKKWTFAPPSGARYPRGFGSKVMSKNHFGPDFNGVW